jgi:hypothetical protein
LEKEGKRPPNAVRHHGEEKEEFAQGSMKQGMQQT